MKSVISGRDCRMTPLVGLRVAVRISISKVAAEFDIEQLAISQSSVHA
jgi:hypothetical protein